MIKNNYSKKELIELVNIIMQKHGENVIEKTICYNANTIDNNDTTIFAQMEDADSTTIVLIYDENGIDRQIKNTVDYINNQFEEDHFVFDENTDLAAMVIQSTLLALNELCEDKTLRVNEVISQHIKSRLPCVTITEGKYEGDYFIYKDTINLFPFNDL